MFTFDPTRLYPKQTESRALIRFQDCDPLQHLNNAKYLDYYFNAREDQVAKQYGFDPGQMFHAFKTSWVAYQHQIAYISPAKVSEWIRIRSRLIYVADDTIVTEFFMTDDAGKTLKNVLWSISKHVSVETGRRVPHSPEIMAFLDAIVLPDAAYPAESFNDRIRVIKAELNP